MTRLKKAIFSVFCAALLATGFIACSSDDSNTVNEENTEETVANESNTLKSLSVSDETYLTIDDKTYIYDDGFYHRYVKDEFDYTFKVSELDYNIEERDSNYVLINNNDHSEKIEIVNFTKHNKGNYTFDIQIRDLLIEGVSLHGVKITENNPSSMYTTYGWGTVIKEAVFILAPIVIDIIIDDKPKKDPNLVACQNTMNKLNCQNGQNPYMEYSAGSWFSGHTCNVGCR